MFVIYFFLSYYIVNVSVFVLEARAELLGGPDKFVKRGSTLRLVCVLRRATEPPSYVFWYHGGRMVNYDSARGLQVRHGRFSSELTVEEAQREHSGNYSCVPSNARAASIAVHVINGQYQTTITRLRFTKYILTNNNSKCNIRT